MTERDSPVPGGLLADPAGLGFQAWLLQCFLLNVECDGWAPAGVNKAVARRTLQAMKWQQALGLPRYERGGAAIRAALAAVVNECEGPGKPFSTDSYLPPRLLADCRAALALLDGGRDD
ncbi:hypothetical protein [Chitinilyticum litopenaei]|uniref:hypothetical protein n=1 Tax=Chitinilyticum litopenaei TaxID=1121276 RepID=UPI00048AB207|nr:hypothetical protein [Chitinilyticum litopenaei]